MSIPIPTQDAEPASQAAITAPAPPSNIPRLVRAARQPRSQQDNTPERRRTGQEWIEMREEANEEEVRRQGNSLPESEPAAGNTRERRRAHGREEAASGRAGRLSSLERLRQRCEASPNNRGLQRTLVRLEERQDNSRRRSTRLTSRNSQPAAEQRREAGVERLRARQAAGEARWAATVQATAEASPHVNRHSRNSGVAVLGARSPTTAGPARRNI